MVCSVSASVASAKCVVNDLRLRLAPGMERKSGERKEGGRAREREGGRKSGMGERNCVQDCFQTGPGAVEWWLIRRAGIVGLSRGITYASGSW